MCDEWKGLGGGIVRRNVLACSMNTFSVWSEQWKFWKISQGRSWCLMMEGFQQWTDELEYILLSWSIVAVIRTIQRM